MAWEQYFAWACLALHRDVFPESFNRPQRLMNPVFLRGMSYVGRRLSPFHIVESHGLLLDVTVLPSYSRHRKGLSTAQLDPSMFP